MTKCKIFIILFIVFSTKSLAQTNQFQTNVDTQLQVLTKNFFDFIIKKDSIQFYNLFNENPVTFVRKYNSDKNQNLIEENSVKADYFNDDYKTFFRYTSQQKLSKFELNNLKIKTDDYLAEVTFDYCMFKGRKKKIWGHVAMGLIFKNKSWNITRVVYSMEQQENLEP